METSRKDVLRGPQGLCGALGSAVHPGPRLQLARVEVRWGRRGCRSSAVIEPHLVAQGGNCNDGGART